MDTHVVIVGGGFAGINLAEKLTGTEGVRVTLVDRHNYFQPLLYQAATGLLEVPSISVSAMWNWTTAYLAQDQSLGVTVRAAEKGDLPAGDLPAAPPAVPPAEQAS